MNRKDDQVGETQEASRAELGRAIDRALHEDPDALPFIYQHIDRFLAHSGTPRADGADAGPPRAVAGGDRNGTVPATGEAGRPRRPGMMEAAALFEAARRGDADARRALADWFDRVRVAMREGRVARLDLESTAYLAAERLASEKLGGSWRSLEHDPASVATRHWERFRPFCDAIDQGQERTVDQMIAWVKELTRYVLIDLRRERDERREREGLGQPVEVLEDRRGPDSADPREAAGEEERSADRLDDRRAVLRLVLDCLDKETFLVVVLHNLCNLPPAKVGEILGMTAYQVTEALRAAATAIGRKVDRSG
jgi:DNA-directed RNA polymerase specialized sigma24 family protein